MHTIHLSEYYIATVQCYIISRAGGGFCKIPCPERLGSGKDSDIETQIHILLYDISIEMHAEFPASLLRPFPGLTEEFHVQCLPTDKDFIERLFFRLVKLVYCCWQNSANMKTKIFHLVCLICLFHFVGFV